MAAKEGTTSTTTGAGFGADWGANENPFFNYSGKASEALKEVWTWQVKTGQSVMDQSIRVGQSLTDFAHTQVNESVKLGQEFVKNGLQITEDVRKSILSLTDRIHKQNH